MTERPATFKDQHPELQYLVKEVMLVREHNLRCVAENDRGHLLIFAEGALVLLALERFVRIVLGPRATHRDTPSSPFAVGPAHPHLTAFPPC